MAAEGAGAEEEEGTFLLSDSFLGLKFDGGLGGLSSWGVEGPSEADSHRDLRPEEEEWGL